MTKHLLITLLLNGLTSSFAMGKSLQKGPSYAYDHMSDRSMVFDKPSGEELRFSSQRHAVNLMAPLPLLGTQGKAFVTGQHVQESRRLQGASATTYDALLENSQVTGFGLVTLFDFSPTQPQLVLMAHRFSQWAPWEHHDEMREYFSGGRFNYLTLPWGQWGGLKHSAQLYVRLRQYPGFDQWLPFFGYRLEADNGWAFDALYPSHGLVSYEIADHSWLFFGGMRVESRDYPFPRHPEFSRLPERSEGSHGWIKGHVEKTHIGIRRELTAPLFISLEAGLEREYLSARDLKGDEWVTFNSRSSPYGRLALEMWVEGKD